MAALTVLALAGCSGGSPGEAIPTDTSFAPSDTASPTSPAPSVTPSPTASLTVAPADIRDGSDDEYLSFLTPSGNIHCAIYPGDDNFRKGLVRCDVSHATWKLPPKPTSCEFDWGTVMTLETKPAAGLCVSDAVDVQGAETVAYGHGLKWHNITCVSQKTGLTCTNTDNQHGFTVSRAAYTLF